MLLRLVFDTAAPRKKILNPINYPDTGSSPIPCDVR